MFADIITATIVSMILGMTWYGPLFGKQWMKYMKITPKQMRAAKKKGMPASSIVMMIVSALVSVTVFSFFAPTTFLSGIKIAALIWIGFFAPIQLGSVNWEGKPWGYFFLNTMYNLVNLIVMSLIFAAFN